MTWENDAAAQNQLSPGKQLEADKMLAVTGIAAASGHTGGRGLEIKVGKRSALVTGKEIEIFTMTLGSEKIDLLPLKTWAQLDLYKWRVRGILPATPAGLEIGFDHTKLMGQTVLPQDPEGCAKLESLFSQWLEMEHEALEATRRKAQLRASRPAEGVEGLREETPMRFQVQADKEGQVHVSCVKGKEVLATIGLNTPGFQSLVNQGWMRKPHALKTGALHDWVELDGALFSFEKGRDSSAELAKVLNEGYLPPASVTREKEIVIYANAASPTGFDIQFQAKVGGTIENRRRPLAEESLALLQDQDHCGLIHQGLVIKLSRPSFIFKQKTADGGERYLEDAPENLVRVVDEDGLEKIIDLCHPVNYLHLRAIDLTAVFNHPSINRHAQAASGEPGRSRLPTATVVSGAAPVRAIAQPPAPAAPKVAAPSAAVAGAPRLAAAPGVPPRAGELAARPSTREPGPVAAPPVASVKPAAVAAPPEVGRPLPNLWARPFLAQPPIRFDWFTCLIYAKIANWVGNSDQGTFEGIDCWHIQLGDTDDMESPEFRGLFDTRNGAFGYLSGGYMVRFESQGAFLGTVRAALEGRDVHPIAVGLDAEGRLWFIVNDGYRAKFGVPDTVLAEKLAELKARGGKLISPREVLESRETLEVIWTVPAQQRDLNNPEAMEQVRPDNPG